MYIEHAHGRADLLADGFDEKTVDTVMRLVDRAEWKRRQYPLGTEGHRARVHARPASARHQRVP